MSPQEAFCLKPQIRVQLHKSAWFNMDYVAASRHMNPYRWAAESLAEGTIPMRQFRVCLAFVSLFLLVACSNNPAPTIKPTETLVPEPTPTPFYTLAPTRAVMPTNTPQPTYTPTPVPTNTQQPTHTPTPVPTNTQQPTYTPTPVPTNTPRPTATPTARPVPPHDYHGIGFPLNPDDVLLLNANFGCPTDYGDGTHDGLDIVVTKEHEVPVFAVDDGVIIQSNWVNDAVGHELCLLLGQDADGNNVYANYVHMDRALPVGTEARSGDTIAYITSPHGGHDDHILYFGIRVGDDQPPGGGARGDEVDITELLISYVLPGRVRFNPQCPFNRNE